MDIESIKKKLLVKYPFFGSVVANSNFVPAPSVGTAGTDGKNIYYNPSFIESITNDQQTFVFAHEICHIAFDHIYRSEGKDKELWNIAADSVTNAFLKQDGLPIIKGGIDIPEAINYDVEEMYKKLLEEKQRKQQLLNNQQQNNQNQQGNSNQENENSSGLNNDNPQNQGQNRSSDSSKQNSQQRNNKNQHGNNNQGNENSSDLNGSNSRNQNQGQNQTNDSSQHGSQKSDEQNKSNNYNYNSSVGNDSQEHSEERNDVGHDTHSMWDKSIEKKHQEENSQSSPENHGKDKEDEQQRNNKNQHGNNNQGNENSSDLNGSNSQNQNQGQNQTNDSSQRGSRKSDEQCKSNNSNYNSSVGNDSQEHSEERNDVGHDTHSMWDESIEKKHQEENSQSISENHGKDKDDEHQELLDKLSEIFDKEKEQQVQSNQGTEQQKKNSEIIKRLTELGEKETFKQNGIERKKQLEELRKALASKSHGHVPDTNSELRVIKDIGTSKPLLDWRILLKEAVKYDVDWSFQNAGIEDGVVTPYLEEQPKPETEIVLDTSGSINETLLRNFLRECKNILQTSNLKVGCFDTKFYGFTEIKNGSDIDNISFYGGGGTNFDVAVNAFSKRVENKIIFTDGAAYMPSTPIDAIWVVFGRIKINPAGGKVIHIDGEQLKKLYNYNVDDKEKGRTR